MTHSGRQFGGAPNIPVRQEHTGLPSTTLQSELAPHGDGTHGFVGGAGVGTVTSWHTFFYIKTFIWRWKTAERK